MMTTMQTYAGFKITARDVNGSPQIDVFDPRDPRAPSIYRTTSLDLAMKWVDAYQRGEIWAVTAQRPQDDSPRHMTLRKLLGRFSAEELEAFMDVPLFVGVRDQHGNFEYGTIFDGWPTRRKAGLNDLGEFRIDCHVQAGLRRKRA